jgi:CRP/FNR family transcriptional regulator
MAEAEGPTEVLLVPSKVYDELVDASPEWRRFTFALYSKRLELVLTLVEEVAFHHVDSRIAAYLLKHSTGQPAEVRKTHGEIALELGTSREVVSRILGDFEAGGLILTERGRIRIQQPAALGERTTLAPSV